MDGESAEDQQRDEQAAATMPDAIRAFIRSALLETHTCLPGIVRSFDAEKQTATVQPALKTVFVGEEPMDLPLCVDVPVVFPAGGDFVLTFPVKAGDEGLMIFAERAIDFWWDRGGTQLPSEVRFHDLSDAFFLAGVSSRPRFLVPAVATDAVELRTRSGTTVLRLENGKVTITAATVNSGGATGVQRTIMGDAYRQAEAASDNAQVAALTALVAAFATRAALTLEVAAFTTLYPGTTTLLVAIGTWAAAALGAVQGFEAGAPNYLTSNTRVK